MEGASRGRSRCRRSREDPDQGVRASDKARTKEAKKQSGNYPMPDKTHARNAKARAAQAQKAGTLSKEDQERIDRKADKILDE